MNFVQRIERRLSIIRFKRKGVYIGKGAIIHGSVDILNPHNVSVGNASILYKNCSIYPNESGSFTIGNKSHIAPFGYILIDKNKVNIGDNVAIGPFCAMICHSNHIEGESQLFSENYLDGDILIGDNVFIGAQCTILPGAVIEDNVVVASNSVVKGKLEANAVYGGSPAKKLKDV